MQSRFVEQSIHLNSSLTQGWFESANRMLAALRSLRRLAWARMLSSRAELVVQQRAERRSGLLEDGEGSGPGRCVG